jgi:hypothetical protein
MEQEEKKHNYTCPVGLRHQHGLPLIGRLEWDLNTRHTTAHKGDKDGPHLQLPTNHTHVDMEPTAWSSVEKETGRPQPHCKEKSDACSLRGWRGELGNLET